MECCLPGSLVGLFEAWRSCTLVGCGLLIWRLIPYSVLWSIWKERNGRIFSGRESSVGTIIQAMVLRIAKGKVLYMFSKHVGIKDSNGDRVLAILEALRIFTFLF